MIKLVELLTESNTGQFWYHGRAIDNDKFSLDYVGSQLAYDQEGPGFYFTDNFENAKRYSYPNGIVLTCNVYYNKILIKDKTKVNKNIVIDLIKNSPVRDDMLTNFDENPKIAFVKAVNSYVTYKLATESYQTIAHDFYKYNSKEYLIEISKYYDGQKVLNLRSIGLDTDITHLIVYRPDIIKVLEKTTI